MESEKTLLDLGWPIIVEAWAERCRTSRGADAVREQDPCASQEAASKRATEIKEARRLEDRAQPMSFGGIVDVRAPVVRAQKGSSLEAEELIAIAESARGYHRLRGQLEVQQESVPLLWQRAESIGDFEALFSTLLGAFEPDGRVSDQASHTLGGLRRKVARLQQSLEGRAKSLLEDSRIASELQDSYWTQRDDRYVLPVRASSRSKIPGIVHGSSGSGQTVFVEPQELVELNNELKLAEFEEQQEVLRILAQLSARVGEEADSLRHASGLIVGLDLLGGAAKLANEFSAIAPVFSNEERRVNLRHLRHPLMLLAERECVANDIFVEPGRLLVISGPNAGGKTVALKSVGLAVMMSRYGLHILASEGSSLPWFDEVRAAIGDAQSLESELSTFSAHLVLLREFIDDAGPRSLVLIDEICSATEPEQGGALAQAVLENLAARQVTTLVTTHYERLKLLASKDDRFANASVGFDLERLAPTFRVHLGVPGASAAIDVARRMGLAEEVNLRAQELAGGGRTEMDELLREVSAERERLIDERAALAEERAATARAYEETTSARIALDAREKAQHEKDYAGALGALRSARDELDLAKNAIKKRKKIDATSLREQKEKIDGLATAVHKHAPVKEEDKGPSPRPEDLAVGTAILIPALGGKGVVLEKPNRGRVLVQVGLMKSKVGLDELRLAPTSTKSSKKASDLRSRSKHSYQFSPAEEPKGGGGAVRNSDSTLDLRGERAHEAIASVDRFVDTSLLCERDAIFIVHGHGMGALRKTVREHLETHPSVTKWRPGEVGEGGDGVTVAWLDS